jgi:hypothetical protein
MGTHVWGPVDPTTRAPNVGAVHRSQAALRYERVPIDGPGVRAYLAAVDVAYLNGGGLLARFRVHDHDATLRWYASRGAYAGYGLFRHFVASADLRAAMPELKLTDPVPDPELGHFFGLHPLTLDGYLALQLAHGGMYDEWTGTDADAKKLAQDFVADLFGDRYEDMDLFHSNVRWTPWLWGIYRTTWLLVDRRHAEITLLLTRDTD